MAELKRETDQVTMTTWNGNQIARKLESLLMAIRAKKSSEAIVASESLLRWLYKLPVEKYPTRNQFEDLCDHYSCPEFPTEIFELEGMSALQN